MVENAFGILALRFRCLFGCLDQSPETVDSIILACVTLHNLLRIQYPAVARQAMDHEDEHNQLLPGEWRQGSQMTDGDYAHARNRGVLEVCLCLSCDGVGGVGGEWGVGSG